MTSAEKNLASVYERKCVCCGRVFSVDLIGCDACSCAAAKKMADYRYNIHRLFCNEENYSMLKHSA